jgi:hypothetical protein
LPTAAKDALSGLSCFFGTICILILFIQNETSLCASDS